MVTATAWLIISTVLLALPGSALPKEDWLSKIWFDKWVHIGMFAILIILYSRALSKNYHGHKKLAIVFTGLGIAGFAYGIGMEFIQKYFIANRYFDWGDIIADGVGCAGGVLFSIREYIKK